MKTILKKTKHSVKIYFYQCDESKIWLESFFIVQEIHFLNLFEKWDTLYSIVPCGESEDSAQLVSLPMGTIFLLPHISTDRVTPQATYPFHNDVTIC